jgi:hypothetical protein
VGAAALPDRSGQGRADRLGQAAVRIGGHQRHAGQATCGEVTEETQPPRAVLGAGDVQAQDLAIPAGVDTGRDQGVHVDRPPGLADLQHQRIRGDDRVRPGVQRPGPECLYRRVEIPGHL